tara:strand:- start:3152 stop:6589 length:3438 start_codon:yes stop_codon:yes gene_type:complete
MMGKFVHLQVKSHYSISSGLPRTNQIVDKAIENNMDSVALTDKNSFFGLVKFYNYAISKGIKPICGVDFDIKISENLYSNVVLLAKNKKGLENLFQLSTKAFTESAKGKICLLERDILANLDDLICIMPTSCDHLEYLAGKDDHTDLHIKVENYLSSFKDNIFFGASCFDDRGYSTTTNTLCNYAFKKGVPVVGFNDVLFLSKKDHLAHQAKVSINNSTLLKDEINNPNVSSEQYFKTVEEMQLMHSNEILNNTNEVAKSCNVFLEEGQYYLPSYQIDEKKSLSDYLEDISKNKLENFLKKNSKLNKDLYRERLEKELKIITEKGYPGYFLIVMDIVSWAKGQNIPVGPGRGSGAGSLVAYVLSITTLDPLIHGLLFERFLNPERMSLPDFDIDFCIEGRDKVIEYVQKKYGENSVAQIGTTGTMAARGVIRDVTRILGKPYGFGDMLANMIPLTPGIKLGQVLNVDEDQKASTENQSPELQELRKTNEEAAEVLDLSLKLEGCARSIGKHAAGVVIAPNDIHEFTPLHFDPETNSMATQLDMYDVEEIGLVKFDFLGLRTLTVINNAVHSIETIKPNFKLSEIPYDDPNVYKLLSLGKTKGLFQLESRGMIEDVLKKMKPENFADIVAAVALFRPGPLESGMASDYINRKNGRESIIYQHPLLKKITNETYGVFVYQEQVMEAAQVLASYSLGDADNLRRAMGKKKADVMEEEKSVFVKGCENNNISKKKAEEIFANIATFAGYGFNKSHSAAYALIAYQTAYLKTHYPSHFIAAVLSSEQDKTDKLEPHVKDCELMKVEILPPSINSSYPNFIVNEKNQIEYALGALKGVGRKFSEEICIERKNGPFTSMMDFATRVDLRKGGIRSLKSMAKAGAFDCLCSRDEAVSSINSYLEASEQKFKSKESGVVDMFDTPQDLEISGFNLEKFSDSEKLKMELESFGFYYSKHPISLLRRTLSSRLTPIKKLMTSNNEKFIPVLINSKRIVKKGTSIFIFLEVSDETGVIDVSVPIELYDLKKSLFKENSIAMLKGNIITDDYRRGNLDDAGIKIRLTDILPIDIARSVVTSKIKINVPRSELKQLGNGKFKEIKNLNDPDGMEVILNLLDENLNISSEIKVDTFKISLEDSTFEKIDEIFGEDNYTLI